MYDDPRLLVVDDEEVICQGCERIFSGQGINVETSTDANEGLRLASQNDYLAILLDMKMPAMDGIRFLEELRKAKPDTPVIVITGYPSASNAVSAKRWGITDYITKPFAPEAVTQSVLKLKSTYKSTTQAAPVAETPKVVLPEVKPAKKVCFWDETWVDLREEGTARVGAMLTRMQAASVIAVRLPRISDTVYQGLPLASLTMADRSQVIVSSPLTGVVRTTNERWSESLSTFFNDPQGNDWLATIAPSRFDAEIKKCRIRHVILFNADQDLARDQADQLAVWGCQVRQTSSWSELSMALKDSECDVLLLDAASVGEGGPALVGQMNASNPSMKVVVIGGHEYRAEVEYRKHKIFYYAIEPFGDQEIIDIIVAAFRPKLAISEREAPRHGLSEPVSKINITNRRGTKVCLLVSKGMMKRDNGLGWHVRSKLLDRLYPMETTMGLLDVTPIRILDAACNCDRLFILRTKDTGRIAGSLVRDSEGEGQLFSSIVQEAHKVTSLLVQPAGLGSAAAAFDARITAALAEHIVNEMVVC